MQWRNDTTFRQRRRTQSSRSGSVKDDPVYIITGVPRAGRDDKFIERIECEIARGEYNTLHKPLANAPRVEVSKIPVVSRIFRTFNLAERHPALGHAVMAPLICWSFSNSMFRYLLVDHAVPAMWRSLAAARLSAD